MKSQRQGEMSTADLYCSAFLKAKGVTLLRADRDGQRVYFVFEETAHIDALKLSFFDGSGDVPALRFTHEIKTLKGLVHSY